MAVADLPPRTSSTFQDVCPYYEFEGDSSRILLEQFGAAIRQWQNRPSVVVNSIEDTESILHVISTSYLKEEGKFSAGIEINGKLKIRKLKST